MVQHKESGCHFLLARFRYAHYLPILCTALTCSPVTAFWGASLVLLVLDWRSGKLHAPRDPPFTRPGGDEEEEDEESSYEHIPPARRTTTVASSYNPYDNSDATSSPFADPIRYSAAPSSTAYSSSPFSPANATPTGPVAPRPSMDAYGAFSDPAPSGFGASTPASSRTATVPPTIPEPDLGPKVSRTMQYADPYAAVRASIAAQQSPTSGPGAVPPSYESYQGYR